LWVITHAGGTLVGATAHTPAVFVIVGVAVEGGIGVSVAVLVTVAVIVGVKVIVPVEVLVAVTVKVGVSVCVGPAKGQLLVGSLGTLHCDPGWKVPEVPLIDSRIASQVA